MPLIGPNTLGTLIILLATILLIIVNTSAVYSQGIFFLEAKVSSGVSSLDQSGTLKMGVFGYCVLNQNGIEFCSKPSIGYALDPNALLSLPHLPDLLKPSSSLIETLTKALAVHGIAGALTILALISALVSHIEEFSKTCWTSCLASLAATSTLIALIFDFILFSIIRSRINATQSNNTSATFGVALWLTLIAWICLAFSGCFFCAGRCLCSFIPSKRVKKRNSYQDHYGNEKFKS
ncbi:hypothetical protein O181_056609 [Austropuccinia psidii MF-1]|uniref:Pali-domain-containing protein n=1 Tax=Austropuccinia psidii MF-1 TaxID=1389203 RepID=A0A9Q3HVU1_9BASI|nr:hypothetical protein [Austropuccinia psidii MF-1]